MKKLLNKIVSMMILFSLIVTMIPAQTMAEEQTVYLEDMPIVDSDRYTGNMGDSFVDKIGTNANSRGNVGIDGTVYQHGIEAWVARWNFKEEKSWAYSTFDLQGAYYHLDGKAVLIKSYNTTNFNTTLYFYGDDQLLASYIMTPSTLPFDISIDVTGVEKLKIYAEDNGYFKGGTSFGLTEMTLSTSKANNGTESTEETNTSEIPGSEEESHRTYNIRTTTPSANAITAEGIYYTSNNKNGSVPVYYDETELSNSSMNYNHTLARFAIALDLMTYGAEGYLNSLLTNRVKATTRENGLGYTGYVMKDDELSDASGAPYTIVHKKVMLDGQKTEILLVLIRGTKDMEWLNNFDSGYNNETHNGFQSAADYVYKGIQNYVSNNYSFFGLKSNKIKFDSSLPVKVIVTGHSRGAATANLIGKKLDDNGITTTSGTKLNCESKDMFFYTFATPNVTSASGTHSAKYNNIYNIVNPEDFVTKVMPSDWGYSRYGITYVLPSKSTDSSAVYSAYKNTIIDTYKNQLRSNTTYVPYTTGTFALMTYIKAVTAAVSDVDDYYHEELGGYIRNLATQKSMSFLDLCSLHNFYKYALGGNQSNNNTYVNRSYLVMGDALLGGFGTIGKLTLAYFVDNQVLKPQFATAHMADTYYAGMNCITESLLKQKRGSLYGIVNCPVDVTIYDADGSVIGRIVNNEVDESIEDGIVMYVDGDAKYFQIPEGIEYSIELTGNDEGVMDYSLSTADDEGNTIDRVYYQNVPLEDGTSMTQEISEDVDLTTVELIDENQNVIEETGYFTADNLGTLDVNVTIEGVGSANSLHGLVQGDYVTMSASTDQNNSFLGWYDEDGNLITEDSEFAFSIENSMNFTAKFTDVVVDVNGISVADDSFSMNLDDYECVEASVLPSNATDQFVLYSSSDDNVVTVDECGILHAVGEGKAFVTVTTDDGNYSSTISVTVGPKQKDYTVTRYSGDTRYDTAIESAEALKEVIGVEKFENVVIASGVNFPDALAGSPLATELDAPILLVGSNDANKGQAEGTTKTIDYIKDNLAEGGTVYILGGTSAVSQQTEDILANAGFVIDRLAGDDRYETNMRIISNMDLYEGMDVVIVRGYTSYQTPADKAKKTNPQGYADSLSVSGVAGYYDMPIILAGEKGLTDDQMDLLSQLKPDNIYVIGGTSAISDAVYMQIEDGTDGCLKRIAGNDRYQTSVAIAEEFGMQNSDATVIAYGKNYPDGLTGGVLAAKLGAPLLLAETGKTTVQQSFLKKSNVTELDILGGTSVLPDAVINALAE